MATSKFWKWAKWGYGTTGVKAKSVPEAKRKARKKLKREFKDRTVKIERAVPSDKYYKYGGTKGYYTVEYKTK